MKIQIPEFSLVVLMGASGAGKTTFAARHFLPTEVLSSDRFRGLVSDDEANQGATADAFAALHFVAARRLANRRLTVVDATNVKALHRAPLLDMAKEHGAAPVAIALNVGADVCLERNQGRDGRDFNPFIVRTQVRSLRLSLRGLKHEGFEYVYVLSSPEAIDGVEIERTGISPHPNPLPRQRGPRALNPPDGSRLGLRPSLLRGPQDRL